MILIVDNYDSFTYNLYQAVASLREKAVVVKNDELSVEEAAEMAPKAVILSPGPGAPEAAGISIDLVRAFSGRVPLLGICLGHQAIVAAHGGRVVRSNELFHGRSSAIYHDGRGLFRGLASPFSAARYHSLTAEMEALPRELSIIARCDSGSVMAVKARGCSTYGLQFHPESIMTPCGIEIIARFVALAQRKRRALSPFGHIYERQRGSSSAIVEKGRQGGEL